MFGTTTLVSSGGGAVVHGARLTPTAMFSAMCGSETMCVGGAPFDCALSLCTVFAADTTRLSSSVAAFCLAHFPAAAATGVCPALVSDGNNSGTIGKRADPQRTMLRADSSCFSGSAAAFRRACYGPAVLFRTFSLGSGGVGGACVRCAASKGTVLHADSIAEAVGVAAIWTGAGRRCFVLAAMSPCFIRNGSRAFA